MKLLSGLAFLALTCSPSFLQARVGDSLAECVQRYGPSSAPASNELPPSIRRNVGTIHVFHPDGWEIWACMIDGICVLQFYQKALYQGIHLPFFQDEEEIIKQAEAGRLPWKQTMSLHSSTKDPKTGVTLENVTIVWSRPEGISLTVGDNRKHITVTSPRWNTAYQEANTLSKAERLGKLKKF